jgi:formylglycine-generating enzyme required for sulfatase activity
MVRFFALVLGLLILLPPSMMATAQEVPSRTHSAQRCEADGAFAWVEGGAFVLGSTQAERDDAYRLSASTTASTPEGVAADEADLRSNGWFDDEPERTMRTLAGFCISRTQVTNADYLAFVRASRHRVPGISRSEYQAQGFLYHPYETVERFLWAGGAHPQGEADHPVVLVSYDDAVQFATWKGRQDGHTYRLPTADEWEKAARGGDGRVFPWGDAWRGDVSNWAGSGLAHTSPVAAFPAGRSPYGIDGMAGQVFEFTSTLVETSGGVRAVMKNCGWDDSPGFCRGAYRHTRAVGSRHILIGFRLVRED